MISLVLIYSHLNRLAQARPKRGVAPTPKQGVGFLTLQEFRGSRSLLD